MPKSLIKRPIWQAHQLREHQPISYLLPLFWHGITKHIAILADRATYWHQ